MNTKRFGIAVLVVLFTTLTSVVALAQEPSVTIGPGVFTFPELADKLSIGGRTVVCGGGLRKRAAFVYLKDRSWYSSTKALESALAVEFHPDGSRLVIQANPVVQERERKWLGKWLSGTQAMFLKRFAELERRRGAARIDTKKQIDQLRELAESIVEANGGLPNAESDSLLMHASDLFFDVNPREWTTRDLFQRGEITMESIRLAMSKSLSVREGPASMVFEQPSLPEERSGERDTAFAPGDHASCFVIISPAFLTIWLQFYVFPNQSGSRSAGHIIISEPGSDVYRLFAGCRGEHGTHWSGLGEDAVAWLARGRATTQAILGLPSFSRSFRLTARRAVTDLSQVIEAWSRQADSETVMELWPAREGLEQLPGAAGGIHSTEAKTELSRLLAEPDVAADIDTGNFASSKIHPWTLRMSDGVLTVENRLSFLDRATSISPSPALEMERTLEMHALSGSETGNLPMDAISAYARHSSAPEKAFYPELASYRGVSYRDICEQEVGLVLWEAAAPKMRQLVLDKSRTDSGTSWRLTVGDLGSEQAISACVNLLRNVGSRLPEAWRPDFANHLRQARLSIHAAPSDVLTGATLISIHVAPSAKAGHAMIHAGILLMPVPKSR